MKYLEWLRWVSFAAAITILLGLLLFPKPIVGSKATGKDVMLYVSLGILPAVLAAILSLTRNFWWLLVPGFWFTFMGVFGRYLDPSDASAIIHVSSGLVLVFTPILAVVLRRKM